MHQCINFPSVFHCAIFPSIVCYLHHIHPYSFQSLIDLSSLLLTHKLSFCSIPTLHFSHSSFCVNIFLKIRLKIHSLSWVHDIMQFFQDQTNQMLYELLFLTLTEVFLVRLDSFPHITFCPALCSSNVTKTSSGWWLASDLLAGIWHQCSLKVLNHKICQTALAWAAHRLLWWLAKLSPTKSFTVSIQSHRASSICVLVCNCPNVWRFGQTHTYVLKLSEIALFWWFLVLPISHCNFSPLPLPNCRHLFIALLLTIQACCGPNPLLTSHAL